MKTAINKLWQPFGFFENHHKVFLEWAEESVILVLAKW